MLEVLKFIFSDFWIWLGAVILIAAFGNAVASLIYAMRGR
jgi:hypothetical protein